MRDHTAITGAVVLARTLAGSAGLIQEESDPSWVYGEKIAGVAGTIVGRVQANIFVDAAMQAAGQRTAFDEYPLLWDISYRGEDCSQQDAARAAFDLVVAALRLPVLLVHNVDVVRVAWDPENGLREFPPETSVDEEDSAVWSL